MRGAFVETCRRLYADDGLFVERVDARGADVGEGGLGARDDIDEDITIAATTFEENPVEDLPPPPTESAVVDVAAAPVFTPMTVRPEIRNRGAVVTAMERAYPPILRDAGLGGQVIVWFFIPTYSTHQYQLKV